MKKVFGRVLAGAIILSSNWLLFSISAIAEDFSPTEKPNIYPERFNDHLSDQKIETNSDLSVEIDVMEQVTSVSQLTDVQPTDWAFTALQSLVERYGCIEGYPNRTYRGNRALTRYEFAAGLNSCLGQINQLIGVNSQAVSKEDLFTIQKLQETFATELASLSNRIDILAAKVDRLETQLFSTTTKLRGLVTIYLADAFGENAGSENNPNLGYQAYLNLITSFTGKDRLIVTLGAGNIRKFDTATEFPNGSLSGTTDEALLIFRGGGGDNEVRLNQLKYSFPIGESINVFVDASSSSRAFTPAITELNNLSTGAVSFYGRVNPLFYPTGHNSSIGLHWLPTSWLDIGFTLGSEFQGNNPRVGLFDGGYTAAIEPLINLGRLRLGGSYQNTYSPSFGIDSSAGSNASKVLGAGPVIANTYVVGGFYRFSPNFDLGGSIGYSNARALGEGTKGDAQVWDYRVNLLFPDLGKKGNIGGLIVGIQPKLTGTSTQQLATAIGLPDGQRSDRDTGFHIEAYYAYRLNDNTTITPGFIWLTAPNHDARNPDVFVGLVRTTFSF